MTRYPQRTATRRRYLHSIDVMADLPLPFVGQRLVAMRQTWISGSLALVHAWEIRTPNQQIDAGRAGFERSGGAVHGRRTTADHGHALTYERGVVSGVGRMRPAISRQSFYKSRQR